MAMPFRDSFGAGKAPENSGGKLTDGEIAVMHDLAVEIVARRFSVAAIMFFESAKPLNWIGSQGMIVFEPIAQPVLSAFGNIFPLLKTVGKNYETLQRALEKRESVEILIQKIEALDADAYEKEKAMKKDKRKNRHGFWARFRRNKGGGGV